MNLCRWFMALVVIQCSFVVHASDAQTLKLEGNDLFKGKDYLGAKAKYDEAINILEQGPSEDSQRAIILSNAGLCLKLANNLPEALKYFERAYECDSTYFKAIYWCIDIKLNDWQQFKSQGAKLESMLSAATVPEQEVLKFVEQKTALTMMIKHDEEVPDFFYWQDFLASDEEKKLVAIFEAGCWDQELGHYDNFGPKNDLDYDSIERSIAAIIGRMFKHGILPKNKSRIGLFFIRYNHGGFLNYHKDSNVKVGDYVMGLSLGGSCSLNLKRDRDGKVFTQDLAPRSLYKMGTLVDQNFMHSISDSNGTRYGILFYEPKDDEPHAIFDVSTQKILSQLPNDEEVIEQALNQMLLKKLFGSK